MLLRITHTTKLNYSERISESVMELRVTPRQELDQHRLSFDLAIGPKTSVTSYFDWLGNTVHAFTVMPPHDEIQIIATSVVECDRRKVEPDRFGDTWPVKIDGDYALFDYLTFGGPVVDCPALRALAADLGAVEGTSLGELALRMLHLIGERFHYERGITSAASPITDILEHGRGVCQDFTHLMIGLARVLGIPARYVSGLVHPDAERYRGFTETHAWAELFFPSAGWIGFDPTNQCVIGGNFVQVAGGRDYRDVSPNRGIYRGRATEKIEVFVNTEELTTIPGELAAERMRTLPVPVFHPHDAPGRDYSTTQHQSSQQQQ